MYKKILFFLFFLSLNSCAKELKVCNFEKNPENCVLMIGFVPSQQAETLKDDIKPLEHYLQKNLQEKYPGLKVESFVAVKYMGLIAGMKAGKVDIGFLAPFSYLLSYRDTKKINKATQPLLRTIRFGKTSYRSQIIASKKSGIKTIADVENKLFAFTDPASTSGFLYPQITLLSEGIDYRLNLKNYAMLGSHDNVIQSIYRGDWDAGATFEDARKNFVKDFPDIAPGLKVKITFFPQLENSKIPSIGENEEIDWCPQGLLERKEMETTFWNILMRYTPPSLDKLASEINPFLELMEKGESKTVETDCGKLNLEVVDRWEGEIIQIALTAPIPNDIIAARGDLDSGITEELKKIFLNLPEENSTIFQILKDVYSIEGFEPANHEDFLELEKLAEKSGLL